MMPEKAKKTERGFTLIEIMVVIGIIGILASIAIPNYLGQRRKSFCSAAETDANNIAVAIADYFSISSHTAMIDITDLNVTVTRTNTPAVNGTIDAIVITVVDGSGQCPDYYMDRDPNWTTATSTYTKTIP